MSDSQAALEAIRTGYTFDVPALDLGSAIDGDTVVTEARVRLPLGMLNRHGLVAGATGTGKTVTLQVLAQAISDAGVPVFAADMKGDLSGMATPGEGSEKLLARTSANGQDWAPAASPVEFLALGGEGTGVPLRASVTSFGPLLLSKVLELNDTQESVLGLLFHYADAQGLALLDLKDLKAVLTHLTSDEGKAELKSIGGVSSASVGVILRSIANLEAQGADVFFGEPEFDIADLLRTAEDGRGIVSMLELPAVQNRPALFSTFLMWLLAELFETLPEVGDPEKPALVFFFDEAHLLFRDASKAFLDSVAQTVRLIRSKGVGIVFVTQSPTDVPDEVLAQLGSSIQHALRAHTPKDAKALKATVETFPITDFDLGALLTGLGTGEAVVTVMDPDGSPTPVAPTRVFAPASRMGPTDAPVMEQMVAGSPLQAKYGEAIDRESAHELLTRRYSEAEAQPEPADSPANAPRTPDASTTDPGPADTPPAPTRQETPTRIPTPRRAPRQRAETASAPQESMFEKVVESQAFKQFTRTAAREIARGIFGTGRRRRR
ncbi:helicase HerA-like domain-containing protein [Brevibacterium sp. NPDC049920]|uniref:DUF853 domain-containing protein n=1 Tax=Brevibacterium pityocampae TaxID=506594 RepID=A0ABP8JI62_9MICO|nr:helicase HerA-like domain-containing protein [uncultured Brevibacterium sp.]